MYVTTRKFAHQPATEPVAPKMVDNPVLSEIFSTGIAGIAMIGGAIIVTLECLRCDHLQAEPVMERAVAGRIALTAAGAQALVINLNAYLEAHALSPTRAIVGEATFQ